MTDWTRGDEAVCIRSDSWWRAASCLGISFKLFVPYGPKNGDAFTVRDIALVDGSVYLEFDKWPAEFWHSIHFRKRDKIEGSKSAWRAILNKCRRKVPVDA